MNCTIYENIFEKVKGFVIPIDQALARIQSGKSKGKVLEIRNYLDKDRQDDLKKNLPCVLFSGEFTQRFDEYLQKHSGFIVLDFDNVDDVASKKEELSKSEFTYACWVSPRNNGLKCLVKIADGKKHREHFDSLREKFPDCDKSGVNESRVCYESFDPEIYINKESSVYKKVKIQEKIESTVNLVDEKKIFLNLVRWLTNKGDAFITGERNNFIFKVASACCRFGLDVQACTALCIQNFEVGTGKFSVSECESTIESAYKSKRNIFGSAQFEKDVLVDIVSRYEIEITQEMLDESIRAKDVIFGEYVKEEVFDIFNHGYREVNGIGIPEFDNRFKFKQGEISLLSGYGNYGKSSFWAWHKLMRLLVHGERTAFFSPEDNADEFYHALTETLVGADCTPSNPNRPSKEEFEYAYDFISKNIFYVYPKQLAPTPDYIKERFLELIIKEKVKGVVIDPFNQLTNDYGRQGGRTDKYLETFLSDCTRFAQTNNIYFTIVAHPTKQTKDVKGNYPCPDVFDIADGAMWNNKMDNIVIYHRPNHQVAPDSDVCEFHSKKIRRQKIVGKKGVVSFNYSRKTRRFIFSGIDFMARAVADSKFYNNSHTKFDPIQDATAKPKPSKDFSEPIKDDENVFELDKT